MKKIKIAINGFGRIGRAITRINLKHQKYELVAINDIDPDVNNLAYLLKYDTTYGKLRNHKVEVDGQHLVIDQKPIKVFSDRNISNIPWNELGVDVVIDASGVLQNVINAPEVLKTGIKKVIVTHAPKQGLDFTYMFGVNHEAYDINKHHIVSSSICDANAVAPFYKMINDAFGIEMGEVTTLHPWLSYQNLLDGTIKSVSSPGHYWSDYALGRSSIGSLIPKETSLCGALDHVLPSVSENIHAASFRTPTSIVSAADGVFILKNKATKEAVLKALADYSDAYPGVLFADDRSLVSIDYLAAEYGAVVDTRWLNINKGKLLKFVLWYDNEWGYASRIFNMVEKLV